jgi:hypothetical protein
MTGPDRPDPEFDAMTVRLLRREALRRATREINTASAPGLETMLAQISAEVTAEAVNRVSGAEAAATGPDVPNRSALPKTPSTAEDA